MAIIRWNPMREFWSLQDEIQRMNEGLGKAMRRFHDYQDGEFWHPSIDLSETEESYNLKAELPGINPDEISIEVNDNVLTLSGERKEEKVSDKENCHVREMLYGKFSRSVSLPVPIDAEKIKAKFESGVLKVTIPKSEKVKPRKIEIEK